jgi:hypothetical protein
VLTAYQITEIINFRFSRKFCAAQSRLDPPNVEGTNLRWFVSNQSRTLSRGQADGSLRPESGLLTVQPLPALVEHDGAASTASDAAKKLRILPDRHASSVVM